MYALSADDIIQNYPHSHHFNNLPLRLGNSNDDVRELAMCDNINRDDIMAYATEQIHEFKRPLSATGPLDDCQNGATPGCQPGGLTTPPPCDPSDEKCPLRKTDPEEGEEEEGDTLADLQSQLEAAKESGDFTEEARLQELVNDHFASEEVGEERT